MILRDLNSIGINDLKALIENSIPEGKTIEYKLSVKLASESDRKEFLYDISSFANAGGGDIIFGVKQDKETGYPEELVGIDGNMDDLQLQFDSIIRDGISPRLIGTTSNYVKLDNGKHVFILRVTRSWNPPHQVVFKGADKFYSRSNTGKYKLDVTELKNIIIADHSTKKEIARFVDERISTIVANEGPVELLNNGKIILHIIPLSRFNSEQLIDIRSIMVAQKTELLRPLGNRAPVTRYNFDGLLSHVTNLNESVAYLQLFRNGILETVESFLMQSWQGEKKLYVNTIEEYVLDVFRRAKKLNEFLKINSPIIAFLTITGAKGFRLELNGRYISFSDHPVDKETLRFTDLLIEDWSQELDKSLKPWFDTLWNSVGVRDSLSYQDGIWKRI